MIQVAVSISDLTKAECSPLALALGDLLSHGEIVDPEPERFDGTAVAFECDEERFQALLWLRERVGLPKNLMRFYVKGKRGGWRKI